MKKMIEILKEIRKKYSLYFTVLEFFASLFVLYAAIFFNIETLEKIKHTFKPFLLPFTVYWFIVGGYVVLAILVIIFLKHQWKLVIKDQYSKSVMEPLPLTKLNLIPAVGVLQHGNKDLPHVILTLEEFQIVMMSAFCEENKDTLLEDRQNMINDFCIKFTKALKIYEKLSDDSGNEEQPAIETFRTLISHLENEIKDKTDVGKLVKDFRGKFVKVLEKYEELLKGSNNMEQQDTIMMISEMFRHLEVEIEGEAVGVKSVKEDMLFSEGFEMGTDFGKIFVKDIIEKNKKHLPDPQDEQEYFSKLVELWCAYDVSGAWGKWTLKELNKSESSNEQYIGEIRIMNNFLSENITNMGNNTFCKLLEGYIRGVLIQLGKKFYIELYKDSYVSTSAKVKETFCSSDHKGIHTSVPPCIFNFEVWKNQEHSPPPH